MKVYAPDIEELLGGAPGVGPDMAMGAYEAASRTSRELALYTPAIQSADMDMLDGKPDMDGRGRDMLRNDATVQAGANTQKDSIVGSLFALSAKPNMESLRRQDKAFDEKWEEEFQEEVETEYTLYAEASEMSDAGRSMTLTEQVRLAIGTCFYGGDSLWTVEWIRDEPVPYQTALMAVEVDRLSTPYDRIGDTSVVGGIKLNRRGAAEGYFIRKAHPSDMWQPIEAMDYNYVPAMKPWGRRQVIYIKEQVRPDQTRAVASMAAAMGEMRSAKRFRQILLQNAITNASYAASIESELPHELVMAQIGAGSGGGKDPAGPALAYAQKYLDAIAQYGKGAQNLAIDGAKIPHLFPGTKLQLRPMGTPGGVGTEFEAALQRYLAAAMDTTYEEVSRDFSKTNYSSIKAALQMTGRAMRAKKKIIADRYATAHYMLWFEEALNKGRITSLPRNAATTANFYDRMNRYAYTQCEWIGAGLGQIDELKETQAAALRLKMNLTTLEFEHRRFGMDWRRVIRQKEREKKILDAAGLSAEVDSNMLNAASGSPRSPDGEGD